MSEPRAPTGADTRAPWRLWTRRLAPWVITAGVVALLLRKYPLTEIAAQMREGHALAMIPFALGTTCGMLFWIALCDTLVMRGALGRPRYWDVVRGKAATSMLLAIGYGFGQGGYALWIARATRSSVAQTASVALYIAASDMCALSLVTTAAVHLGGADVPAILQWLPPVLGGGLLFFALIAPLRRRRGPPPAVFAAWPQMPRANAIGTIAGRCINLASLMLLTWGASRAFGMDIPLVAMAVYMPVIFLVGSLPLNVGGFGVVQGVWVMFFDDYAPGAQILAFQFLWQVMSAGGLVLRGAPFIRKVIAEIERGKLARSSATPASESRPALAADR